MKIKGLVRIQSEVEGQSIPNDIPQILNLVYYSKSKKQLINIGDLHLTHFLRIFAKMFDNKNVVEAQVSNIKERILEIEDKLYKEKDQKNDNTH
tara:strand:- start:7006 stop:7287 length:282 start_codon:yes stop_codon:yes gene_type:complete